MKHTGRRKLNIAKRFVSFFLLAALVLTSISIPERVSADEAWENDATTTVRNLIIELVQNNIQLSIKEDAGDGGSGAGVSDDEIIQAFEATHLPTDPWYSTNLHTVVEKCVQKLVDQGLATLDNSKLQTYAGSTMPLDYALGALMVDWARANVSQAAMVSDETLVNFYDELVTAAANPYITLKTYGDAVMAKAKDYASDNNVGDNKVNVLNTDNYITYRDWVSAGNIARSGTLFVGTWMVDAQAINSTTYSRAIRSMADDDQQIMYYKSELAGGRWRDISSASSLNAILPAGEDVADTELLDYYISVIIGPDGILKNPKTGEYIDIFNITDPYSLDTLPELKGVRLQIDSGNLKSYAQGARGSSAYTYDRVKLFFEHDVPFPRSQEMQDIVNYWKTASQNNHDYVLALDYNGGYKDTKVKHGWKKKFLWWSWWSTSTTYKALQKRYTGDMQLVDMLQTEEEYGHIVTYYWCEGNGGDGRNTWYDPFPKPRVLAVFKENSTSNLASILLSRNYVNNLRHSLRGEYYYITAPLVGYYGPWDSRAISIMGTNDMNVIRYKINMFKQFWAGSTSLHDEETDLYDRQLASLSNLYLPLKQAGYDEEADRAMLLQDKIDSARRSKAYYNLVMNDQHNYGVGAPLNNLFSQVAYGTSDFGRSYSVMAMDYGDDSEGTMFEPDSSMMEVVGSAVSEATSSFNQYDAVALKNGDTVAQQFEYDASQTIINNAAQGAEAMLPNLQMLVDLDNILESTIQHKNRELTTLEALLASADARVQEKSHEVANQEYINALNDPDSTDESKRKILQTQKAELSGCFSEDQQFIKARVIRQERTPALEYIDQRINWADGLKGAVSSDDYGKYELEAINAHIDWLEALRKMVIAGFDKDESDPNAVKANLNLQKLDLLDNGDLDGASNLDKEIADADKDIDDKRNRNLSILDGAGDAASKVDAGADLDGLDGAKRDIGKDIDNKIENDDWDRLPDLMEAAADLGLDMDDLSNKLKEASAPVSLQHLADDEAERSKTSPFYDNGNTGDGNGDNGDDNGGNGPYDGDGNGDGNGPGGGADDGSGNNGDGSGGGNTGPGGPDDGGGPGSGDNGGDGSSGDTGTGGGSGSGAGNGANGRGLNGGGGGGASGLDGRDLNGAIQDAFGGPFDSLSDSDKASVVAGLNKFADNRDDDEIRQRVKDLLNQLLAEGNGFIYRQYLGDLSQKYVSLAAVDKCRPLTKNRCVYIGDKATMSQITGGSASYVFTIGATSVESNDGKTSEMRTPTVLQSDPSIHGSRKEEYPYIVEESSSQYLKDTCEYIPDTEWAILIAPSMSKKVIELLEVLDELADE